MAGRRKGNRFRQNEKLVAAENFSGFRSSYQTCRRSIYIGVIRRSFIRFILRTSALPAPLLISAIFGLVWVFAGRIPLDPKNRAPASILNLIILVALLETLLVWYLRGYDSDRAPIPGVAIEAIRLTEYEARIQVTRKVVAPAVVGASVAIGIEFILVAVLGNKNRLRTATHSK